MKIDINQIRDFEHSINTLYPERGEVPIQILGYGEISLVFEFVHSSEPIAYKRLPIFDTEEQVTRHIKAYDLYHKILTKKGINVPLEDSCWLKSEDDSIVLYCAQQKIDPQSIGNAIIHHQISQEEIFTLIKVIMRRLSKIWLYNQRSRNIQVGIDGQISNWAVIGYDPANPRISEAIELLYLDTSTPLFRINSIDAMEPVLFLKSAPSFLRWLLEALFLEEVVGRYYDFRLVTIDIIANFYKEQKAELIPQLIKLVNDFFSDEVPELEIVPLSFKEVDAYYNGFLGDRQIWVIFQAARRMDRYLQTRMLGRKYNFYLPGKIKR
ncbi:MAG: DUF6206 family protein [Candidatus Hodarchaeales archaeon]|jgi:hypothetical protein